MFYKGSAGMEKSIPVFLLLAENLENLAAWKIWKIMQKYLDLLENLNYNT